MRTFEIMLILTDLFTIFLSLKGQSKITRLRLAEVNIFMLLIHGVAEGFRYQMAFSYFLSILFTAYTLVKTRDKFFDIKNAKVLKVTTVSLCFIFLGLTTLTAYVLPIFNIPKPTGSDVVGIKYLHLIDENRNDPFLDGSSKKRELMIKVFYPAMNDDSKPFDRYFHNSSELIKSFAEFYNMPDFTFQHLSLVKTNSKEDLQISDKETSYPVVLFSHGAGTTMEVQTSQCEDLASNGYIVVSIDHTYVSSATAFPDRIVSSKEAKTNFNLVEPAEIITKIMAEDSKFVIESLSAMNSGEIYSIFKEKLNLDKIGTIGHSVGGAVAYDLAINDSRIKAAIDLDGVVFVSPKESSKEMAPFLMLANDKYHVKAIENKIPLMKKFEDMNEVEKKITLELHGSKEVYEAAYNKAQENTIGLSQVLKKSGNLFTIEGSDHMKFTDIGFFIGTKLLRELVGIKGNTTPERCLEITKSVTVAFFNEHLKNETKDWLEGQVNKYSELKKVNLE